MNQLVKEINKAISERFNIKCNGNTFAEISQFVHENVKTEDDENDDEFVVRIVYDATLYVYTFDKKLVRYLFENTENFHMYYGDNCETYDDISFLDSYNEDFEIGEDPAEMFPLLFQYSTKNNTELKFGLGSFLMGIDDINGVIKQNNEIYFDEPINFDFPADRSFVRFIDLCGDLFEGLDDDKFKITFGTNEN